MTLLLYRLEKVQVLRPIAPPYPWVTLTEPSAPRRPLMCLPSGTQQLCSAAPQDGNKKVTMILKSYEEMWNFLDQIQLASLVGHHKFGSGFA